MPPSIAINPRFLFLKTIQLDFIQAMLTSVASLEAGSPYYRTASKIGNIDVLAETFMNNSDHGYEHSVKVWMRCLEIFPKAPRILAKATQDFGNLETVCYLLQFTCLWHDLSRFLGYDSKEHQRVSAELAYCHLYSRKIKPIYCQVLYDAIVHHDFLGREFDQILQPAETTTAMGEIFRLADKTSSSPQEELERWYLTGKRFPETKFIDFDLPDKIRFDFAHNMADRDFLTYFLLFFGLSKHHFYSAKAQSIYQEWAKGKISAFIWMLKLTEKEPTGKTTKDATIFILEIFNKFFKRFPGFDFEPIFKNIYSRVIKNL